MTTMMALDPITALVVHPATQLFPAETSGPEFDALYNDIAANGLQRPIVRTQRGAILDGRRRALACRLSGQKPLYRLHVGDPWRFVLTVNQHRLGGNGHRAMVGGILAADPNCKLTGKQLVELTGVSSMGTMLRAKAVARSGIDALRALVETDQVPLTTAARIAGLSVRAQETFVARIDNGGHPRFVGKPGWRGEDPPPGPPPKLSQRQARYRYVQEPALQLMANSFDGLGIVLASADGLDPAISPEQAAYWRSDLSRRSKSFRRLLALLAERAEGAADPRSVATNVHHHHGHSAAEHHPELHSDDDQAVAAHG
jgi:hypothetical protein